MRILVQKFGGTSLSTQDAREHAVRHILREIGEQYAIVVVVSAMGRRGEPYATDTLLDLAERCGGLAAREKDLLMSCGETISAAVLCAMLQARGVDAVALTGAQAGIETTAEHGNARIVRINAERLVSIVSQGKVAVVAGFQGASASGEATTLGRGGSDTSATALGAALKADFVDIYTDVEGVLTADPRIVTDARPLVRVTYAEICNMAYNGAKVIHPRAVEVARDGGIPIRIRSTFSDGTGTLVAPVSEFRSGSDEIVSDRLITGIAHTSHVTQIQVASPAGPCDLQLQVFKTMANHGISVDLINVHPAGVAFTVADADSDRATALLRGIGFQPAIVNDCTKISVVGGGMSGVPGVMALVVEALAGQDIDILQSADSHTTIWVLVRSVHAVQAVNALHRKFHLHKSPCTIR